MKKLLLLLFLFQINSFSQFGSNDSGGILSSEQSSYDVLFYDINLTISPSDSSISGFSIIKAKIINDINLFVLDLDNRLNVSKVTEKSLSEKDLYFEHKDGKLKITFPGNLSKDQIVDFKIYYSGIPKISQRPPWDDGFVWTKTSDGKTFAGVACQGGGTDIWLPVKDHPSDEPDSVSLNFTVPENLVCVANGKLRSKKSIDDIMNEYSYFISTPINNYNITFYLAPYKVIEHEFKSIDGEYFPVKFYVLPENYDKAKEHTEQFLDHLKFYEKFCGPYPFRIDGYNVVEAPYLGMEHQTVIAYGLGYENKSFLGMDLKFDWLHHHELSHEWWGNLVTARDWKDFWIHEGIGSYMQSLYNEQLEGKKDYHRYMLAQKSWMNKKPIAPTESTTASEAYHLDIYYKGSWVIHTLRYYLGDEVFFRVLRKWAYPTTELEKVKDGKQCRFSDTEEIITIAERESGKELSWFFEVYLRNAELPQLKTYFVKNEIILEWITKNDLEFDLPVEVKHDGKITKVEMVNGVGRLIVNNKDSVVIDPDNYITMDKVNFVK